jgi:hypothetical protein
VGGSTGVGPLLLLLSLHAARVPVTAIAQTQLKRIRVGIIVPSGKLSE